MHSWLFFKVLTDARMNNLKQVLSVLHLTLQSFFLIFSLFSLFIYQYKKINERPNKAEYNSL